MVATTTPIFRNPLSGNYPGSTPATHPIEPTAPAAPNVGPAERIACVAAGGLLALYGLSRRSLGALGAAAVGTALLYRGASGRCALYDRLGVNTAGTAPAPRCFEQSVVVHRPAINCYLFWRHLDNAPRFMEMVRSVRVIDDRHSHWEAKCPHGGSLKWDAFVYDDEEGERICWRTLPGADIGLAGCVTFTELPDLNLTEVRSQLRLGKSLPWTGSLLARLFGQSPDQQMARDLKRFKELLDGGEPVPESAGFHYKPRWRKSRDVVDVGSDLSFPASDPPAW